MSSNKPTMPGKWEARVGNTFIRSLEEEILAIGETTFTLREVAQKIGPNIRAARRLHLVVKSLRLAPKDARDLARKMSFGQLIETKGVGVATIYVWMKVMEVSGLNPLQWLNRKGKEKISTMYAQQRKRKKRRASL